MNKFAFGCVLSVGEYILGNAKRRFILRNVQKKVVSAVNGTVGEHKKAVVVTSVIKF